MLPDYLEVYPTTIRSEAYQENTMPYRLDISKAMQSPSSKRAFTPDCTYVCHPNPEPTAFFSIGGTDVKPQENDPFYGDSYFKYKRLYEPLFGKSFGFKDRTLTRPKFARSPFNSNSMRIL